MDSSLNTPFEIKAFDGGMTDFFLQAAPNFYELAENFNATNDSKLEVRDGSAQYVVGSSYRISGTQYLRADTLLLFDNDKELLPHSGKSIFTQAGGSWTEMLGWGGNPVFSHGAKYSFATAAQWNGHLFVTNSDASFPAKIYKNEAGDYKALTSGLPQVTGSPSYSEDQILALCLTLANQIRTSMISHFQDAYTRSGDSALIISVGDMGLHYRQDLVSLSYLQSVTFLSGDVYRPTVIPTPAPAATDLASLKTLVTALSLAQAFHTTDAIQSGPGLSPRQTSHGWNSYNTTYHDLRYDGTRGDRIKGPNIPITSTGTPIDLDECVERLNKIRQLWYFHTLAVFTHGNVENGCYPNNYTYLNRYAVTAPAIPARNEDGDPVVTGDYTHFISFCGSMKYALNGHMSNGWYVSRDATPSAYTPGYSPYNIPSTQMPHARTIRGNYVQEGGLGTGEQQVIDLPNPTDLDSAYLTLFWCRAIYGRIHYADSIYGKYNYGTMSTTAGSASVASVVDASGNTLTLSAGMSLFFRVGALGSSIYGVGEGSGAYVVSSGAGTAVLSKIAELSLSSEPFLYTTDYPSAPPFYKPPIYHPSVNASTLSVLAGATSSNSTADEELANPGATGESINEWFLLAEEMFGALVAHMANTKIHYNPQNPYTFSSYFPVSSDGTSYYNELYTPKTADYIYGFIYKNTYKTVLGVEFSDFSNPIFVGATDMPVQYPVGFIAEGDESNFFYFSENYQRTVQFQFPILLTNFGILTNTSETNYNLTETKLQIYRTIDGGNTFYLLKELDNGTASYSDNTSDTLSGPNNEALNIRETIYTTGGVVGNEPPPRAKFLHILNNIGYYAAIYDGAQFFPNRVIQSIPGSPGAVSYTFFDDFEEDITGISSVKNNVIVFTASQVARLSGGFNELGQGTLTHERVSDNTGCISAASIVQTEVGLFFAGNDGFYFTDGYSIQKISASIDTSYQSWTLSANQKSRIAGAYDKINRRIHWTIQRTETQEDCDYMLVFHMVFGPKQDGVFTTWSNGNSFRPSSVVFFQDMLWRGDTAGFLFYHSEDSKTDPEIASIESGSTQAKALHIPYDYRTAALDFGTTFKGQWATRLHLTGKNIGNIAAEVRTIREDDNYNAKAIVPFVWADNLVWGDPNALWSDENCLWRYDGKFDFWRRFPGGSLRSQFRQIQVRPAYVAVYKYSDYPDGSFAGTAAPTDVFLATPGTNESLVWPPDVVGMFIKFDYDGYYFAYEISAVSGNQLTVLNPDATLLSVEGCKWEIWGYQKEQRLALNSIDIHFGFMGQRGRAYQSGEGGGND